MKKPALLFCLFAIAFNNSVFAKQADLQPFSKGSYQQLLKQQQNRPMMLVIWSVTCPSCMKDMAMLKKMTDAHPEILMILLSVDDFSDADQVQTVLQHHQLTGLQSWLFTKNNSAKLRFEIDPGWYGELPRTYFFNKAQQRFGFSGVLSEQDYESMFTKILK